MHEIEALVGIKVMEDGANKPLVVRGVIKSTGEKDDFLVKLNTSERMHPGARCFEYLGACMAKELDLSPAEPVIIEITTEFIEASIGKPWWKMAKESLGLNYGCYFVEGGRNFANGESLTAAQYKEAQSIFAFDIFASNSDRNNLKQNMVTDGENILIFDHELAFGFIFDLFSGNNTTPWIITERDREWVEKHYFYPHLKGNVIEFEGFVNKFVNLDAGFWTKVDGNLPHLWKVQHIETIKNRTQAFVENKELFIEQLKSILK
ncbi:MAG: hypothetical protein K0S53_2988 [Bacteroidetes bacterium]|nr:hypothetical protein [Bacteroidota bacterium]